jgi:class 3 adenylate cyclase/predicted ATPase
MELGDWLRSLGLGQYEAVFRENEIDETIVPRLTAEDLKDLGVSIVGHRRKLLDGIASLRADAGWKAPPPSALPPIGRSANDGERRQLTVMFCDLIGSTALSARLDPEDMREIIGAYHRCCSEWIVSAGGFVAKYMGDGVLAYFGYPQAHEDDAERAIHCALALIGAVPTVRTLEQVALTVRIGISTGTVVVGDLIGSGESQERGVVGETPNLAARLQAAAEPGKVVIADITRRLAAGAFEYRDLGALSLKGLTESVQAWEVIRPSGIQSRFEARHASRPTPLIGREEEMELLRRRWQQAQRGEGCVVLIAGEPGIGKSRLTVALEESLECEPHARFQYFCSPRHQESALYPTIAQLQGAAGFARTDPPATKLDKLSALLPSAPQVDFQLTAELLSIPTDGRYAPLNVSKQRKKELTFEALLRHIETTARARAALVLYEDVHWIDPSSRELLDLAVERMSRLPVLLLITFRPEFVPPWTGQAHVTAMTLRRLAPRDRTTLVEHVAGASTLPDDIIAEIIDRTDGIPLFVEELTKSVMEGRRGAEEAKRAVEARPFSGPAIPASLYASLMSRLDRLGTGAKEVAQIGAAIGREFSYELLTRVSRIPVSTLSRELARLSDAGLVLGRGAPAAANFTFKHALIRDAAYSSLLREQRQDLHRRIAAALASDFPEICDSEPELLAQHYAEAGQIDQAIAAWQRAGDRAIRRSANKEAVQHLERALTLLEKGPQREENVECELQLLLALGPALMMTRSTTAPEIGRVYLRARELAEYSGRAIELFSTLWGSWLIAFVAADMAAALQIETELFRLARHLQDPGVLLQSYHAGWTNALITSDFASALNHIEAGLALYRREEHSGHALVYGGHDPAVCAHIQLAQLQAVCGKLDTALRNIDDGLELGRSINHPPSLVHALCFEAEVRHIRRDHEVVERLITASLPLISAHGSGVTVANAIMLRGWARTAGGDREGGIDEVRRGLALWRETASRFQVPFRLGRAADAHRMAGQITEAITLIEEGLASARESGDLWFEPELCRLRGELLLSSGERASAARSIEEALLLARQRDAKLFELRAATVLARLWLQQGKQREAEALLAPIYGEFDEALDAPDLKEARAVLEGLSPR